jgi:hypothetical protein
MIHGAPLSSDHHGVIIDYVMDGCCGYNLPYETEGSRCLVDLIRVPLKMAHEFSVDDSLGIQLFIKSIFKLYFYILTSNIHTEKIPPKKSQR